MMKTLANCIFFCFSFNPLWVRKFFLVPYYCRKMTLQIPTDFIKRESTNGVVFFSGDRHFAEVHTHTETLLSYSLYDFTTSPLSSPRHRLFFKEEKKNDDTRVPGSFYSNKNYLKCTIQKQGNQEILLFEYKNKFGKTVFQHALSEKDLGY